MTGVLTVQSRLCCDTDLMFCARSQGRLIAAALCYQAGDDLIVRTARSGCEYFGFVYYLPVRHAIEHGLRSVHLGVSSPSSATRAT
jgi:predicted N-acyltransferase